jgi:hypothetical protein
VGVRLIAVGVIGLAACKAQLGPGGGGATTDAPSTIDGPRQLDAPADAPLGAFSTPQMIPGADLGKPANSVDDPSISSNGLERYYSVNVSGSTTSDDIYLMTRLTRTDPWGTPTIVPQLNSTSSDKTVRLSPNDLTIYFARGGAIYTATRGAIGQPWSTPASLDEVNTGADQRWMAVCNGNYFVLSRSLAGSTTGHDLYEGQIGTGAGTAIANLNTAYSDNCPFLSPDCLTMYFASNRADHNNSEIYMSTRTTIGGAWSPAVLVDPFNLAGASQDDPGMSLDQRLFVFSRSSTGSPNALYYSTR